MSEGLVQRPRLLDRLAVPRGLRVVTAPSGFGKTTLLRSWIDKEPGVARPVVWVALNSEVGTRHDFWQLVGTSAARRGDLDPDTHRALSSKIAVVDDPVPALVELLDGCGSLLLVLDAYEHLRGLTDEIDDDIIRLTSAVTGVEVAVTTRASTKLSDDVLIMRGLTQVIDDADLRFTTDEVEQLLQIHAPHAAGAAARIAQDTRGYPLGVRAAARALERLGTMPAFDSGEWQRLVTEDLKSQIDDPALVDFVYDTSVPPSFDRELAQLLTKVDDVDGAFEELTWNGFGRWIPYARERPAFQYVESVRDVFLAQLRADQPERHRRAAAITAAWLHDHDDDPDLAFTLAIDAHDLQQASTICRGLMISNPTVHTTDLFERQLRRVPRALLPRFPVLAFARAIAYSTNPATRAGASELFDIAAEHALDDIEQLDPREALHQHIGREVSLRYLGRSQDAGAAADAALAFLDSMSDADRDDLGEFLPMARAILAYSLFQVGDLDRARVVAEQAATSAVTPWWRNYALAFVVGINALNGRDDDARAALAMTDPHSPLSDDRRPFPHALGILGQATLHLDEFDFIAAVREFDAAGTLVDVADSWPFITWVLMHARLGLGEAGAEAHRVEEALATDPPRPGVGPNLGTGALLNALAILWLADGNATKAHSLLQTETPCSGQLAPGRLLSQLLTDDPARAVRNVVDLLAEPGHTVRSAAAVETLGAAAAMRVGNDKTALELLERVASRYRLFGVRAHLIYVPDSDFAALRELARAAESAVCQEYLDGDVATPVSAAGSTLVQLTPRETEVLKAWMNHRTRGEVARALFVSANTVKSQLNSAYHKLGVTTKDAAIQRAIELDLLRPSKHHDRK